jgi:ABC-type transport system involved in cytochrome bd biosynthesis fused ATPase/permease subunit
MIGQTPEPTRPVPTDAKDGLRQAAPRWVIVVSAGLAWSAAIATAILFARLGTVLDEQAITVGGIVVLVSLGLVAAASAGVGAWFSQWAASTAERRLRRAVVSRVFDHGVTDAKGRSGELLSLATEAVERATHYRAAFLGPILGALTTPFLVLAVMALTVDPVTAGWLALLVLLVPLLIGGFQRVVSPIGAAYRTSQARLTAGFLEAIQALETLVYARAATRVEVDLAARGEEHRRRLMRLLAGNQLLIFVVDAAFSLTIVVAAAGISVGRVTTGELTLGGGIAIVLMSTLVIGPVDVVGQFFYIGIGGRAAQRQLTAHLGRTGADGRAGTGRSSGEGEIVLHGVTVGWPDGPPVVQDFSLRVEPGERVALVGPSGAGKSTVAALIQGHLGPEAGAVHVDGFDLATTPPELVRTRLAVVEQRAFLFHGTISDNLRLVDPAASDERLWNALERAGLRAEVDAMALGLDTPVGEHGSLLSGGQAQRLAIARAWLRDAPILLLDEPTSQVDLAGEADILAALDRLAQGRTVLMIAHRPGAILAADRIVRLGPIGADA